MIVEIRPLQCAELNLLEAKNGKFLRELRRHSSKIRTGCANQRSSGSVRGAASNGCPYRDPSLLMKRLSGKGEVARMLVMNDFVAASFEFDESDGVLRVTLEGQLTDTREDCRKPPDT
jgi:hypothetical protein